jgi:very-short-patch-repair endonuclease
MAQHGVVARRQLLALGFSSRAIKHRVAKGRLHPLHRGVYAVGRRGLSRHGHWMAAVLACGPGARLSHTSAGALWRIGVQLGLIEVSVPLPRAPRVPGIRVHRRGPHALDRSVADGIPVIGPVQTMVDLATRLDRPRLEAAVNEADKRDLVDPESLRAALTRRGGQPGVRVLCELLDRRTFVLTDSELERRFLPIARRAGLARPLTGQYLNGFKVDFYWPDLGLVVETDGLRYHRTAAEQARDRLRDQTHAAIGLTPLRFTHSQVRFEPDHVCEVLARVARRLTSAP